MQMSHFEEELERALGINEEKDSPTQFKHKGTSKKTQGAAHRFDKGVKFVEMKYDDQFKTGKKGTNLTP
jgi:hypothetical protein